ncbi:MAG: glucokinase [Thauera sp.]|nr:glucokinase [Thauera sp.]
MNPARAPYPRLVADIGGTNARFALIEAPDAAPTRLRTLRCAEHAGPEAALRAWLEDTGTAVPDFAAFGIATPIDGDAVAMTNHPWRFSVGALRAALGLRRLTVVNDFTALALSLPALGDGDLLSVGGGEPRAGAARALIGAGTGLGVSGLLPAPGGWVPLQGEGGHVTLPATNAREAAVVAWLGARHGHVSAERVLSGPGLVSLHEALRALDGLPHVERTPAEITEQALAGGCHHCVEALELFCALLGTVAGDLVLTLGARGGLYIGGGIVPRLGDFFLRSAFRVRFVAKGRFRAWLEQVPSWVIVAPHAALTGASAALDRPIEVGFTALAEPDAP